jgi:hypothetical protein
MIYLHIGLGKSGSSTIQHFATANTERLRAAGLIYPGLTGRSPEHHMELGQVARMAQQGAALPPPFAALREAILRNEGESYLISSEFFLRHNAAASARNALALRDFLGTVPVRVLVYIREYPPWVESLYAQKTKRGENADDMDAFIRKRAIRQKVSILAGLRPWVEVFGAGNLRLRSLNPGNLVGGDLVEDLLAAIGVTEKMPPFRRANESPPWTFLEMARNINGRMPDAEAGTRDMFRFWLKRLAEQGAVALAASGLRPGRVAYLSQADWIALRDAYNADVLAINDMLPGHQLPLMIAPPPPERGPAPSLRAIPPEILAVYLEAYTSGKLVRSMPPAFRVALRPLLKSHRRRVRLSLSEFEPGEPEDEEQEAQAGYAGPPVREG